VLSAREWEGWRLRRHVLRISVRTLAIRFIIFAFTLVVSCAPPKPGDCGTEPQPTVRR
jgi:hypothetical protein